MMKQRPEKTVIYSIVWLTKGTGAHEFLSLDVEISGIATVFGELCKLALKLVLLLLHNIVFLVIVHVFRHNLLLFCRLIVVAWALGCLLLLSLVSGVGHLILLLLAHLRLMAALLGLLGHRSGLGRYAWRMHLVNKGLDWLKLICLLTLSNLFPNY